MNQIERIYETSQNAEQYADAYLKYLSEVLTKLDRRAIAQFADCLWDARERGAQIFFLGNGGSAATASHFANDLSIGPRDFEKAFNAKSITDNNAIMTCIGNDFGYEDIFVIQLKTQQLKKGDVVVAISASGNSPNVIKACLYAREKGAKVVGLSGFDGGKLREVCDIKLHVQTEKGEYGPVEDVHMIYDHLIGTFLMMRVRAELAKRV